jgi:hypothetical protein
MMISKMALALSKAKVSVKAASTELGNDPSMLTWRNKGSSKQSGGLERLRIYFG